MTGVRNVVLVHGGFVDGSGWQGVYDLLKADGFNVSVVQNQTLSLDSDVESTHNVLDQQDGPAILVGHSYGGVVITEAGMHDKVAGLVYIAGFAPDQGESLVQLVTKNPGSQIGPQTLITRKYPLAGGGDGTDLYLTKTGFETAFAGDVPKHRADQMWAEQRPFSQEAFDSLSGEPAWKTIPSWYLVATRDKAIPPATQRFMADRAGATTTEVRASHVPMISQPDATTRLILEAANAIS